MKGIMEAQRYLKKIGKTKPALGVASRQIIENKTYIVFTNCYSAFFIAEFWDLPIYEDLNKSELKDRNINVTDGYPKLNRVLPTNDKTNDLIIPSYKELNEYIKEHPDKSKALIELKCKGSKENVLISCKLLKEAYNILNVKQLKGLNYGGYKPIRLYNDDSDSFAIIAPCRKN